MSSTKIYVSIDGCDDSTGTSMTVTAAELDVIARLAKAANTGSGGCSPSIDIRTADQFTRYQKPEDYTAVQMTEAPDA